MSSENAPWYRRVYDALFDFFIGDDWVLAVGTIVVLGLTALLSKVVASWWVMIACIPVVLWYSLRRAIRSS